MITIIDLTIFIISHDIFIHINIIYSFIINFITVLSMKKLIINFFVFIIITPY